MSSNNPRNNKRKLRLTDTQEDAETITEEQFGQWEDEPHDRVLGSKKSRRNDDRTVKTTPEEPITVESSDEDELESDQDDSQEVTQAQPINSPQQGGDDDDSSDDEYQDAQVQPEADSPEQDGDDNNSALITQQEGSSHDDDEEEEEDVEDESLGGNRLTPKEKQIIRIYRRQYPGDNCYALSLNRAMIETPAHRSRKAREPWNRFETFAIEKCLEDLKDSKWQDMIFKCPNIFSNRSNVQIKDRARTEIKRRQKEEISLGAYEYIVPRDI